MYLRDVNKNKNSIWLLDHKVNTIFLRTFPGATYLRQLPPAKSFHNSF